MNLVLDTHVLVWIGSGSATFSSLARAAIEDDSTNLFVSAVTAWEFADLAARKRIPQSVPFDTLQRELSFDVLDVPASLWMLAASLPHHHGDPIDRMLIAHTLSLGMTLISADRTIRLYPVQTIW
jgi:PIN domain nuclease of toxin-antitoxin system